MFSSGNMDERIRMAAISNKDETVVDLFAGIGYFTLPMAVHSKSKRIFACEKNPVSFEFLCKNIVLNNAVDTVDALQGDNRDIAPKNVADRVIMGYIGDTHKFLSTAFSCLKNKTGIIHFHDKFPEKKVPEFPLNVIQNSVKEFGCKANLLHYEKIKSYAPGINHYVFDLKVNKK
jgi:tRNA wybutosine-synthesizing protein 2